MTITHIEYRYTVSHVGVYSAKYKKKIIRRKNTYSNYVHQIKRVTNTDTAYQNYKDKRIPDEKTNHKYNIIK